MTKGRKDVKSNNKHTTNTEKTKEKTIQRQMEHGIELSNKIINNLILNPICLRSIMFFNEMN